MRAIKILISCLALILLVSCFEIKLRLLASEKVGSGFYSDAAAINPKNIHALFESGKINLREKRYTDAVKDFKKAVEEDDKFLEAWYGLGNAYFLIDDFRNSKKAYEKCLKIEPKYANATIAIGRIYLREEELDIAERYFINAISQTKENYYPFEALGDIEYMRINYSKALEYWDEAIKIAPEKNEIKEKCISLKDYMKYRSNGAAKK